MTKEATRLFIDIATLKKDVGDIYPLNCDLDLSEFDPDFKNVHIEGKIKNVQGVLLFNAFVSGVYCTVCDRCGGPAEVSLSEQIESIFDIEGSKDDSVCIENGKIDVCKTAYDSLVLAVPMKILCREDCPPICDVEDEEEYV